LKIVFLIPSLAAGGAERQLATLARELARRGEKVAVVVFYPGGALEAPLRHAGVEVHALGKRGRFDLIGFLARLAGLLRALRPDVLHSYLPTANLAALAMRPFLRGAPIVWGIRASFVEHAAYGRFSRLVYAAERRLSRRPDLIIVNSNQGREHYVESGFPERKIVVVPNGVDTDYFAPRPDDARALRRQWGIREGETVIGIAARLDPMKDHETFLRAAALAAQAQGSLRFVCIGGGAETDFARLRALAESLGIGGRVVFAGECHDMPAAYSAFDIAACSSLGEGFPNMVAEAMACAVPVVATNVGDCARIVGDTGAVVPPRDPEALARAFLRLARLPAAERAALGARARARICERFNVAALADNTLRALRGEGKAKPAYARVLFPFLGETVGGSHRSAALLIRALDRARFEPVVVLHREGPLEGFLGKAEIPFIRVHDLPVYDPGSGRIAAALAVLRAAPRLAGFLREHGIALVHVHDARMSLTWALPARLAGCRLVLHQRTRFIPSRLMAVAARLAHRIVAISNFNAGTLPQALRARTVVVANPFDVSALAPDRAAARATILSAAGLPGDRRVVSFVGTLQEQKRPLVFVEAAARIAQKFREPIAFLMFGRDGEGLAERIRERADALGLGQSLRWLGFRPDIETALAASDLVLAPAVAEGSGRVLIEAALAGTPVVAADSGGHSEIIDDGEDGLLVPPDDPESLAKAALSLLADEAKRTRMAETAAARARARFAPERHARLVSQVYEEVLGRERADAALVIESLGGGGAQHVASTLANRWAAAGRRVCIITLQGPETDVFALDPSVRRIVIGGARPSSSAWAGLAANLRRIAALRRALRESRAPVAIGFVGATNVLLVLAAMGLCLRTIVGERNDPERQILARPWNLLRRLVYPLAGTITANSAEALESLARFVPRRKLALAPNPLREAPSAERAAKTGPTVLAVGRLHPQKGFDLLLEAFARARVKFPDWRLVVLGEGDLKDQLRDQARALVIGDAVDWRGFVPDPFPWYRAADIFVLPSRYEGTANALLEAMSCGLPVVASEAAARGLLKDGETGLVTPAGDTDALAAALGRLMDAPDLRAKLGAAARGQVAALGPDRAVAAWDKIVFGDAA